MAGYTTITARDLAIGDDVQRANLLHMPIGTTVYSRGFGGQIKDVIRDGAETLIEWADGRLSLIPSNAYVGVLVG